MEKYPQDELYAITHPYEIVRSRKDELEKMYIEDYGRKYTDLIKQRMNNIVYMFDSTPDIAYEFIVNNDVKISDNGFHKLEELYNDFMKAKKEAEYKSEYAVFLNMCKYFKINEREYKKHYREIANLPLHGCAPEFIGVVNDENQFYEGLGQEELKSAYLDKCAELKLNPITDYYTIRSIIIENINIVNKLYNHILFSKSMFGEYTRRKLEAKLGKKVSIDKVIEYYTSPDPLCISSKKTLVFIPMIKVYRNGGILNGIFLHEHRHAIESSRKGIGIDVVLKPNLDILNELRTEIKAIADQERIQPMFNIEERVLLKKFTIQPYLFFIEEVQNLFKQYGHIFDECAITNNVRLLQKFFGIKELRTLNNLIYNEFSNTVSVLEDGQNNIEIDCSDITKQVKKLMNIARSK